MQRIEALNPETTTGKSKQLFEGVQEKLGTVPNMMRTMGTSPVVLEGYLNLNATLGVGQLGTELGELIAMTVAQANSCNYCLSAHTFIGEKLVGIRPETLNLSRTAQSVNAKEAKALRFAQTLVQKQGLVTDSHVQQVLDAGYSQGEVGEIVAHVALNIFTNYFNNTANTEVDFPLVDANEVAVV